jgi:hypothetical protein
MIRKKTRMITLFTSVEHSSGSPSQSNYSRERNKKHADWK